MSTLPDFRKPPVVEVVCGVLCLPVEALKAPHFGELWHRLGKEVFPNCEEQPILNPVVEAFAAPPLGTLQISDVPPLPRVWFISREGNRLIQVQKDRFLFNWRRLEASDQYPHFDCVYGDFKKHLTTFKDFLSTIQGSPVTPQQYEVTYVNHIDGAVIENASGNLGRVFRDFMWQQDKTRWLPLPDDSTWRTSFLLPERSGRLHSTVRLLLDAQTQRRFIRFELTARGIGKDASFIGMEAWFSTAHEWIVQGFADLTTEEVQRDVWERVDA